MNWSDDGTPSWLRWAAAGRPHPDERVSGDRLVAHGDEAAFLVALADGLGHGASADESARAATSPFEEVQALHAPLVELFTRAHERARRTRGAALTAVRVQRAPLAIESVAVGNVDGIFASEGQGLERIYLASGVVGFRLPKLRASLATVSAPLVLALATDGLDAAFTSDGAASGPLDVKRTVALLFERYATVRDDALAFLLRVGGSE